MTSLSPPLPQPVEEARPSGMARLRARYGDRALGMALAIGVELLVVLLLILMAPGVLPERREVVPMSTFSMDAPTPATEAPPAPRSELPPDAAAPPDAAPPEPLPTPPAPPAPATEVPPPIVPLTPDQLARTDVARVPPAPAAPTAPARPRRVYGPPGSAAPMGVADSAVVGTAPNGQPMYAAEWYRRPYESELRGYLQTASGPGYGLIACRMVQGYRVEDCVGLEESPAGSQITRAVLAAAWQFRVRPPRVGGQERFGTWVRIRIDYGVGREG